MKDLDLSKLVELMEDVKEAAGKIQLECIQEKPDIGKVCEQVNVGLMGLIGQLGQLEPMGKSVRNGRRIMKGRSSKRNINK